METDVVIFANIKFSTKAHRPQIIMATEKRCKQKLSVNISIMTMAKYRDWATQCEKDRKNVFFEELYVLQIFHRHFVMGVIEMASQNLLFG